MIVMSFDAKPQYKKKDNASSLPPLIWKFVVVIRDNSDHENPFNVLLLLVRPTSVMVLHLHFSLLLKARKRRFVAIRQTHIRYNNEAITVCCK